MTERTPLLVVPAGMGAITTNDLEGGDLEFGLANPPLRPNTNGNVFQALPDELLLDITGMLDFRDVVAVRAVDSRWRAVAVGDRGFATEREKRKEKALWYADVRDSAKRERETKAKMRNEQWLKQREEEHVLLASTSTAVAANKKWVIAAFIAMLIGCTLSVTLGVMLYFLL
jgi:hypothetical protein